MERQFDIITDTCSGMPENFYTENGIVVLPLGYTLGDRSYGGMDGETLPPQEFYAKLREGVPCHTFQVTAEQAKPHIENSFKRGRDVLIVTFSSALSGTASSFSVAANELTESYPARKALVLDSLGGSMGEGMLIEYLLKKAESGATLEETYAYGEEFKRHIQHLFTVDDLEYLRRGGRISGMVTAVGKLLKIKPLLHATPKGTLAAIAKIVGRKRALESLADETKKLADLSDDDPIFIAHGDCEEEAKHLERLLKERLGENRRFVFNYMDCVMGAHGGPGIIAVFFKGKVRE
jgi:DegV family protein with EDD domain